MLVSLVRHQFYFRIFASGLCYTLSVSLLLREQMVVSVCRQVGAFHQVTEAVYCQPKQTQGGFGNSTIFPASNLQQACH